MSLLHYQDNIFRVASDLDLQPSSGYTVATLAPGAIAASDGVFTPASVSGGHLTPAQTTFTVQAGHGLTNGRIQLNLDANVRTDIGLVAGNTITVDGNFPVVTGDTIISLNTVTVYTDMAGTVGVTEVTTDTEGNYEFWNTGLVPIWLMVSDGAGTPVSVVKGILSASVWINPTATGYSLSSVTSPSVEYGRLDSTTGMPLFSFSALNPSDQYGQLLRIGDRAQTTGDSRSLGYFSTTIDDAGAVESQATYSINVYTGSATSAQIGAHGLAQSIPGSGETQFSIIGTQGFGMHLDTAGGTTSNLFGVSGTAQAGTSTGGNTYTGAVTTMVGLRGQALKYSTGNTTTHMYGVYGLVPVVNGTTTYAASGRFDQPATGATNSHAVIIYGTPTASLAFTEDMNVFHTIKWDASNARFDISAATRLTGTFLCTSAATIQVSGQALTLGQNTDADINIAFDALSTGAHITYKAGSTNVFEFDQPITCTGNITSGGSINGAVATYNLSGGGTSNLPTSGRILTDITVVNGANTITLAAPSSQDGQLLVLRCAAITAGSMVLADSGNVNLSAAWDTGAGVGAGDTLTLMAVGGKWHELARSNN